MYTNPAGSYLLPSKVDGVASFRVRAYGFADSTQRLPGANTGRIVLLHHAGRLEYSNDLPASAHAATIKWEDARIRSDSVSQCQFCHQFGYMWTRRTKTEDQWATVISRMEGYGSVITWEDGREFRRILAASFKENPVETVLTPDVSLELPRAKVRERSFGTGINYVHDVEAGKDGKSYGVDMSVDHLWIFDPRTNKMEDLKLPENGLPL